MVIYSTKQIVTSVYNKGCKPRISLIYTLYRGETGLRTQSLTCFKFSNFYFTILPVALQWGMIWSALSC